LRREWYWGSREFAEKALGLGEKLIKTRRNAAYRSSPVSRDHGTEEAKRILALGLSRLQLEPKDLENLSGSDVNKVVLAELVSEGTGVSQAWIAAELRMRSAANGSQQLRRIRNASGSKRGRYKK
jgi:hypothetical protein